MSDNAYLEKVVQYEPAMVFGKGENFFPSDVANYVARCSLHTWILGPHHVMCVPRGDLRLRDLARWPDPKSFLVYADEQYWDEELVIAIRGLRDTLGVEYHDIPSAKRITDASDHGYPGNEALPLLKQFLKLNTFLDIAGIATRGELPRPIFDQAKQNNGDLTSNPPTYYYRVCDRRQNSARYDVIQYWFFYSFNDWATSHFGVNDHEADWESVFVYFDDLASDKPPAGMVYSAHSDRLYRPWSAVKREGDHPIVHVAPGSHASYPPSDIANILLAMSWRPLSAYRQLMFRIMEAWKRGGEQIGGANGHGWSKRHDLQAEENVPWVTEYKGRWGARYLVDMPFRSRQQGKPGGSPGGPMWNSDGTVRPKWEDPCKGAGF